MGCKGLLGLLDGRGANADGTILSTAGDGGFGCEAGSLADTTGDDAVRGVKVAAAALSFVIGLIAFTEGIVALKGDDLRCAGVLVCCSTGRGRFTVCVDDAGI